VLPVLADGRVVLINQFRPAAGGMVVEIPAGRLEPDESPESCVHRELQEEVGYRAGRLEKLGEMFTAVGFCDEVVHLYVATELQPVPSAPEPDEYIEVLTLSQAEALQMVRQGRIPDGKTQLALLLFAGRRHGRGIACRRAKTSALISAAVAGGTGHRIIRRLPRDTLARFLSLSPASSFQRRLPAGEILPVGAQLRPRREPATGWFCGGRSWW
jgi:ADP-ribose pyrophosphatase